MTIMFADPRLNRGAVALVVGVLYLLAMTAAWAGTPAAQSAIPDNSQLLQVSAYERLYVTGDARIEVHQIDVAAQPQATLRHTVELLTPDAIDPAHIKLEASDNALYVDTTQVPHASEVTLRLTVANLKELVSHGAGIISGQNLQLTSLVLEGTGDGSFELSDVKIRELIAVGIGRTRFQISGEADHQFIELAGVGHYNARELHSRYSQVSLHGSGQVDVWADELLDIDIDGVGDVQYNGSPWVLQQISGRGEVRKLTQVGLFRL